MGLVSCFGYNRKTSPPQASFHPLLSLHHITPYSFTSSRLFILTLSRRPIFRILIQSSRSIHTKSWVDCSWILLYPWSHTPHLPSSQKLQYLDTRARKTPCRQDLVNLEASTDVSIASRMKPGIHAVSPGQGGVPSAPPLRIATPFEYLIWRTYFSPDLVASRMCLRRSRNERRRRSMI